MASKQSFPGFSEEYQATIDTIYLIKLNRIGRGLSQQELSFLIGRSKNYVTAREGFAYRKAFTIRDLFRMALSFRMPLETLFMSSPHEFDTVKVRASTTTHDGKTSHVAEKLGDKGSPELLYRLYEYNAPPSESCKKDEEEQFAVLTGMIGKLIRLRFFDKKTRQPLEIYSRCKKNIQTFIRPRLLEKALASYCKSKKPGLKRFYAKGEGYVYIKTGIRSTIKPKK